MAGLASALSGDSLHRRLPAQVNRALYARMILQRTSIGRPAFHHSLA